ncbi:MAG: pre-peptidase C-terminal domain-containing protein [Chitinispirillaceae bacterium]|nr:pre-peptidase C-terminal domain-containing protein [Chitinispirillaceae bacterium]
MRTSLKPVAVLAVCAALVMAGCSNSPTSNTGNGLGNTSNGYFSITEPGYMESVALNSAVPVAWTSLETAPDSFVVISLYKGDVLVHTYPSTSNTGADTVNIMSAYTGSGTDYRLRIAYYSDSTKYDMSHYFSLYSLFSGTITITNPSAYAIWNADSSYTIQWTYTGTPGYYATISLYNNADLVHTFTITAEIITGSHVAFFPANLVSGSTYRVMISSNDDNGICAYSGYFTINGVTPDAYESDNSAASAKAITTDSVEQSRNLTVNDTDWVSFSADSGTTYTIETFGATNTVLSLYGPDGVTLIAADNNSGTGSNAMISWACPVSGTYYFTVTGFNGATGAYTVSVRL